MSTVSAGPRAARKQLGNAAMDQWWSQSMTWKTDGPLGRASEEVSARPEALSTRQGTASAGWLDHGHGAAPLRGERRLGRHEKSWIFTAFPVISIVFLCFAFISIDMYAGNQQ